MGVVCLECYAVCLTETGLAQVLLRHWKLITMHFLVAHIAHALEYNTNLPHITWLHATSKNSSGHTQRIVIL